MVNSVLEHRFFGDLPILKVVQSFSAAFVELFPILLIPILFWFFVFSSRLSKFIFIKILRKAKVAVESYNKEAIFDGLLEVLFFAILGSLGAFLNYLSKGTLLQNLIPSISVLVVLSFQLYALVNKGAVIPFRNSLVLTAGVGAAVSFILSSRYIILLFEAAPPSLQ